MHGDCYASSRPCCPDEEKITSEVKPSFDALGGGYFDAAQAIAARSRATWHQGREYEEDFLYAHFLLQLTLSSPE